MASDWIKAEALAALTVSKEQLQRLSMRAWPATVRGINKRAQIDSWEGRKVGSSQAWEYRLQSLPEPVQQALARALVKIKPAQLPTQLQLDLPDAADLKDYQRSPMEARAALLAHLDHLVIARGLSQGKAVNALVAAAEAGELPPELQQLVAVANARANGSRSLSRPTIYNWLKARETAGGEVVALAPKAAQEAPVPAWADTFMTLYCRPTKPNMTEVLEMWPEGAKAPSYDQVRHFMKRVDAITKNTGRMGPRALKALKAYVVRDASNLWPGAVFVGDGHTFKQERQHPIHGRPFRPEITSILDVYSRRWVGFSIALAENTWSVADALRHAVTSTTCCDIFYYDNGSGANNAIWDETTAGLAARLGITKFNSAPWSSQARGVIERFHSSVMHKMARRSPTYVGQRMDDEARQKAFKHTRKEIKETGQSRILPGWQDLITELEQERATYNDRPHSSLPRIIDPETGKKRNMSPNEMWAQAIVQGWTPAPISEDEARTLFRPSEIRKCRRAMVSLFGNDYYAPALERLHDEDVVVAYDIHDAGKVWISLTDGRFVCEAIWNGNKRDYVPVAFAQRAREKRVEGMLIGYGGMATTGIYQVPASHRVNIGRVATCPVTMTVSVVGDSIYDNVLTITDITQLNDVAGDNYGPAVSAIPQLRLSQDGVTWGAWQNWVAGSYSFMVMEPRLLVSSSASDVTAIVPGFSFLVDVPDRTDSYTVTSLATGTHVSYSPPFNGGPMAGNLPALSLGIVANGSPGDTVQADDQTLSGCTVTVYNAAGIATAGRTVHLIVQGY